MAKQGQQIDELFISLGLDIAQLQLDFDTAGQTVSSAIQKLNSSGNKIKLQMETDLSRLEGVGSELDKIKVKYEAINKQLDLQRQKESILAAVLKDAQKNTGADSYSSRKAETDLLRQQKLIAQTEAELRKLAQAKIAAQGTILLNVDGEKVKTALNNIQDSVDRTNAKIQNLRLKTNIDISGLRGVNSALEAEKISAQALNRELDLQQQKLRQLQNAFNVSQKNYGGNNVVTLNAQGNILRQQQEIEKLQAKIRELNNTKIQINDEKIKTAISNINDSIARMNAKIQNIRLKADIDISALRGANSALEAEKITAQALNRELDLQQQKLRQLQNAFNVSQKNYGGNNLVTIQAKGNLLQQQREVEKLQEKLKELNSLKVEVKVANPTALNRIATAANSAKGAVSNLVQGVNEVNSAIASGTAAISGAMGLFNLSKNAVNAGHDTYLLATRLHTTTGEAGQLKRAFAQVDADATMIIPIFTRLGKQMATAGEDGNTLTDAMRDYGFTLTDSAGRMLPYTQMLAELAKGYKNAQEAGESTEFISNVLGARGANLEPLLANYEALTAAAKDVKATGLLDPQKAEEAYREIKKMEFEMGQLKGAMGAALLPITREMMPEVVSGFKTMVGFISDNKEGLKSFGQIAGDVFGGTARLIGGVIATLGDLKKNLGDSTGTTEAGKILKSAGLEDYLKQGANAGMILGGMVGGSFGGAKGAVVGGMLGNELGEGIYSKVGEWYLKATGEWNYYQQKAKLIEQEKKAQEQLKKIRADSGENWDEGNLTERQKRVAEIQKNLETEISQATSQRLRDKLEDIQESTQKSIEAGQKEATAWKKAEAEIAKAIKETRAEAEKANEELKQSIYELTHNDLQNSFDKVDLKAEEMLNRGADFDLVQQNAELQRQKIQADFDRDVLSKVNQSYQTDLQNKLQAIEQEKTAWQQKGLSEIEASRWTESEKAKIIKDFNNEVAANLDSIYQTALEKRLAQIEREKQAWIQKGVDEVKATKATEQAKVDAQRDAAMQVLKQQAKEYKIFKNEGDGGLLAYQKEQLIKSGINPADLYMTPQQLAEFQKAKQISEKSLLPNFMTEQDRAEHNRQLQQWYSGEQEKYKQWQSMNWIEDDNGNRVDLSQMYNQQNWRQIDSDKDKATYYNPQQLYQNEMQNLGNTPNTDVLQSFSQQTAYAAQQLANFGAVIENLNLTPDKTPTQNYSDGGNSSQRQLVNVNNTIQIDQATAWDSEHIQKLAEKVADVIKPAIEQALRGGENSY